jgi:hypothetical protein
VCDFRAYCGGCRARALSYLDDFQAGDPGCIHNQHVWEEVAGRDGEQNPFVILGQHSPADSHLAGVTGGALASHRTEQLVHEAQAFIDPLDL